jgi:hypothetical protein
MQAPNPKSASCPAPSLLVHNQHFKTKAKKMLAPHIGAAPRAAGQFDCPTQLFGTTKWKGSDGQPVTVYYEPTLGTGGASIAQNILPRLEDLMNYCDTVFGVKGKGGNVIVCSSPFNGATDGSGGAYHYSCAFNSDSQGGSDWYECYAAGNPDMVFGLVMAEVSESYMGLQGKGWNCGGSGGEGLSRFLAEIVANGTLNDFSTGPQWNGDDWISRDQGTDRDPSSIGCAILYCWWMTKQGYSVPQIVQAAEPDGTLATNYAGLTGKLSVAAFSNFKAAVSAVSPVNNDNPFNATMPDYPLTGPVPPSPPPPPNPPSSTLKEQIDALFAKLKARYATNRFIILVLNYAQTIIDSYLTVKNSLKLSMSSPAVSGNSALQAIIDKVIDDLIAQASSTWEKLLLREAKVVIDDLLSNP